MLNFELAKKLKDAGFPQERGHYYFYNDGTSEPHVYPICMGQEMTSKGAVRLCKCPTLEELIEACGNRFEVLARFEKWTAFEDGNVYRRKLRIEGDTPSEAAANLWLAFNKHD